MGLGPPSITERDHKSVQAHQIRWPGSLSRELEREEFARLLERLSPDFAEALLLHDLEGLKYREIAEILGVAPGTIMSRIHRARATLIGWVMHEGKTRGVARVAGKEERA